jgi:hypothetical protein
MGHLDAIVGVLVFVAIVAAIGAADVLVARRRARSSGQLPLDLSREVHAATGRRR